MTGAQPTAREGALSAYLDGLAGLGRIERDAEIYFAAVDVPAFLRRGAHSIELGDLLSGSHPGRGQFSRVVTAAIIHRSVRGDAALNEHSRF